MQYWSRCWESQLQGAYREQAHHRQLDCFLNSLIKLTTIRKAPHNSPVVYVMTNGFPTQMSVMRKALMRHDVILWQLTSNVTGNSQYSLQPFGTGNDLFTTRAMSGSTENIRIKESLKNFPVTFIDTCEVIPTRTPCSWSLEKVTLTSLDLAWPFWASPTAFTVVGRKMKI